MSNRFGRVDLFTAILLVAAGLAPAQASPIAFEEASGAIPFLSQIVQLGGSGLAGAIWFDYDRDSRVDLFLPNGAGQANALYHNDGGGHFTDVTAGSGLVGLDSGMAVAAGDIDNDGYEDLVVMVTFLPPLSASGQPVLLHNLGGANRWLKVRTVGTVSNRDGVGARVTVRSGDLPQLREVYAGSSLYSRHSQTLTFGLGQEHKGTVDVLWPSGYVNRLYEVQTGSEVAFPEVPCSFDDPGLTLPQLVQCETAALGQLGQAGLVDPGLTGRLLGSAVRAWQETH